MAFAGHSPARTYPGPGSPLKLLNGSSNAQPPSSIYGPHSMLPPSPQHYQPRFPITSLPTPSPSLPPTYHDGRANQISHKRPGSSMSISSMLGGEPDRTRHELRTGFHVRTPSQPAPTITPLLANTHDFVSPSHFPTKSGYHEHSYKPRSRTPDRFSSSYLAGPTRQRSSSSGTAMQRPAPFDEPYNRTAASTPAVTLHDPFITTAGTQIGNHGHDTMARRTSLGGLLHRPNSQPHNEASIAQSNIFHPLPQSSQGPHDLSITSELPKQNGSGGMYDTKPPGINGFSRSGLFDNASPTKPSIHSVSPELRRSSLNGSQGRGFTNILNGPTSQPADTYNATSQRMMRQDSARSQSDRSILGDQPRFRPYSPFNSSFMSNSDEPVRKGSDELSHHRAVLGLAQENKRGRYSPLPQAVQGAQAQSPVPDAGSKSDRGRVFSGIGSGMRTTPTPGGMPNSPFKRDEEPMKLSEDNLRNHSRPASGTNKRSRKAQQDDGRDGFGGGSGEKPNGRKRGKHQHNYKADLEEMAQAGFPTRDINMIGSHAMKATTAMGDINGQPTYQPSRILEPVRLFRSRKVIHVGSIFDAAAKKPRKHLGNFTYRPNIAQTELGAANHRHFDVSITPNLLPSFADPDNINCTYTVNVPRLWLQPRERGLISSEHHVWGSGIYTDDSDPVAAAMHAGFLKASFPEAVDTNLLTKIIREQTPQIEFSKSIHVPTEPAEVVENKDLRLTLVVLPTLERYEGSNRYGIRSRTWPETGTRTPHDGVSFGILAAEWADVGVEELKVGRTGHSRRERLRMELEARRKGIGEKRRRLGLARMDVVGAVKRKRIVGKTGLSAASIPRSVPTTAISNPRTRVIDPTKTQNHAKTVSAMA